MCQRRGPPSRDGGNLDLCSSCSQGTHWLPAALHPVMLVRTGGFEPPISWPPAKTRYPGFATFCTVARAGVEPAYLHLEKADVFLPIDKRPSQRTPSTQWIHLVSASPFTQWVGRCSNPRPPGLQPGATPSQLPTQQKKPDVFMTPGFGYSSGKVRPDVTSEMDRTGYSPNDRRSTRPFSLCNSGVMKSWLSFA